MIFNFGCKVTAISRCYQINLEDLNNSVIENKHSNEQNKSELDKLFEQAFDEMEDTYDDIEDANPNKLENQKLQRKIDTLEKKIEDDKIVAMGSKGVETGMNREQRRKIR